MDDPWETEKPQLGVMILIGIMGCPATWWRRSFPRCPGWQPIWILLQSWGIPKASILKNAGRNPDPVVYNVTNSDDNWCKIPSISRYVPFSTINFGAPPWPQQMGVFCKRSYPPVIKHGKPTKHRNQSFSYKLNKNMKEHVNTPFIGDFTWISCFF